jgi:hypothetical protein
VGSLTPVTKYYFKVIATNSAGSSPPSKAAFAVTLKSPFPPGWSDTDVGNPQLAGSATFTNGVYTVYASGVDISGTSDQFHYVYTTITGDGTIVARVASQDDTDPGAKAGVMMRQSLDANSPYAFAFTTPSDGIGLQWRKVQGNGTGSGTPINAAAPYFVKLTRAGSTFTAYASSDGNSWTSLGSITIPMSTSIYVGLANSAHNAYALNTSTFDRVNVTSATTSGYLAIEAGGGPTGTFLADEFFNGGTTTQSGAAVNLSGVTDPAPQGVYQTERDGTFTYTIPNLTSGALYTLRLHFSENHWNSIGQRIFNVAVNGVQVLSNFDIYAAAGGQNTAIVEQFAATASVTGQVIVSFSPAANSPDPNAKVDGIEMVPVQFNGLLRAAKLRLSAVAGQPFSGTVTTFVDADPGAFARDYIATTSWGDGTTTTSTIKPDQSGTGYDVIDGHIYATAGNYLAAIVIQTYDGAAVTAYTLFQVKSSAHNSAGSESGSGTGALSRWQSRITLLGPQGAAATNTTRIGVAPFGDRPLKLAGRPRSWTARSHAIPARAVSDHPRAMNAGGAVRETGRSLSATKDPSSGLSSD